MNTSDALILEFIDGTLDPAREQELFALMAAHPEMRETLRQHVSIGEAVRADRVAYAPPASLEVGLFRSLGLNAPTATTTAVAWWKSGVAASMGGLVAGVMATILVLSSGLGGRSNSGAIERIPIEPALASITTGNAISAAIPTPNLEVNLTERRGAGSSLNVSTPMMTAPPRVIERIRYIERPAPRAVAPIKNAASVDETSTVHESAAPELHATVLHTAPVSTSASQALSAPAGPVPAVTLAASTPLEDAQSTRSPLTAEIRRSFGGGDMASVAALDGPHSLFENMAGALYYSITDSFAVGLEGGYERYAQVLRPSSGDTVMIEQRPAYMWGGATLRYIPGAIPGTSIRPLFQGTLGTTAAGPLVRGRLGATIGLGESVGLNAGFEVGTLFYRYNGTTLASGRWGLTTGLEFKLP